MWLPSSDNSFYEYNICHIHNSTTNPNPSPIGTGFGFVVFGASVLTAFSEKASKIKGLQAIKQRYLHQNSHTSILILGRSIYRAPLSISRDTYVEPIGE